MLHRLVTRQKPRRLFVADGVTASAFDNVSDVVIRNSPALESQMK